MIFSTPVVIDKANFEINHHSSIVSLGSCFAENIGKRLENQYFLIDSNPLGVLYNPASVQNAIKWLMNEDKFTENQLFEYRGLWNSFSHSTLFSDVTAEKTLENINHKLTMARGVFNQMDRLIITFGTAWVYEEMESGKVVSNCHKLPSKHFKRYRLDVKTIVVAYKELFATLKNKFSDLEIILSVSPIRHWKDGAHENTLSKSTLHLAVSELQSQFDFVHYFPSYEILLDELRDYRFFGRDMLHPSEMAIDYIWNKFSETYFSQSTQQLNQKIAQLNNDLGHRPLHSETDEFRKFQEGLMKRKDNLMLEYPFLADRLE